MALTTIGIISPVSSFTISWSRIAISDRRAHAWEVKEISVDMSSAPPLFFIRSHTHRSCHPHRTACQPTSEVVLVARPPALVPLRGGGDNVSAITGHTSNFSTHQDATTDPPRRIPARTYNLGTVQQGTSEARSTSPIQQLHRLPGNPRAHLRSPHITSMNAIDLP